MAPSRGRSILAWTGFGCGLLIAAGAGAWFALVYTARTNEVRVPDLTGLSESDAAAAARTAGLGFALSDERPDETVPEGGITQQQPPAGSVTRPGRTIRASRSLGPARIIVPDVAGRSTGEARTLIEQEGLTLGSVTAVRWTTQDDRVISQHPAAGARRQSGAPVNLLVSRGGRDRVYVTPDLSGRRADDVAAFLEGAGLRPPILRSAPSREYPPGYVLAQTPAPGDALRQRQSITLTVSQ